MYIFVPIPSNTISHVFKSILIDYNELEFIPLYAVVYHE